MPALAKICGLSDPSAVAAALDGGAAFLGLMFFAASPRAVTPAAAVRLAAPARGRAKIVAVVVDPDDATIDQLVETVRPDLFQLHGRETPARVSEIARRAGVAIIKALPVGEPADIDIALRYQAVAEHLMFDAKPPREASRPGGHGTGFDLSILADRRPARPWFLAGGLDPWNVGEAIRRCGAPLVDVSSGVERGPGLKDPTLIEAFLAAVRRA